MMKTGRRAAALLLAVGLGLATAASAGDVEVARLSDADFASYETYGFRFKEGLHPQNALASETPVYLNIVRAADKVLAQKGLNRDDESPDLWIEFQGVVQEGFAIEGGANKKVGGVTWVGDPNAFSMQTIRTGTLIAEVYDSADDRRVWSAWGSEKAPNPEKLQKKAVKLTTKLFEEFPR